MSFPPRPKFYSGLVDESITEAYLISPFTTDLVDHQDGADDSTAEFGSKAKPFRTIEGVIAACRADAVKGCVRLNLGGMSPATEYGGPRDPWDGRPDSARVYLEPDVRVDGASVGAYGAAFLYRGPRGLYSAIGSNQLTVDTFQQVGKRVLARFNQVVITAGLASTWLRTLRADGREAWFPQQTSEAHPDGKSIYLDCRLTAADYLAEPGTNTYEICQPGAWIHSGHASAAHSVRVWGFGSGRVGNARAAGVEDRNPLPHFSRLGIWNPWFMQRGQLYLDTVWLDEEAVFAGDSYRLTGCLANYQAPVLWLARSGRVLGNDCQFLPSRELTGSARVLASPIFSGNGDPAVQEDNRLDLQVTGPLTIGSDADGPGFLRIVHGISVRPPFAGQVPISIYGQGSALSAREGSQVFAQAKAWAPAVWARNGGEFWFDDRYSELPDLRAGWEPTQSLSSWQSAGRYLRAIDHSLLASSRGDTAPGDVAGYFGGG